MAGDGRLPAPGIALLLPLRTLKSAAKLRFSTLPHKFMLLFFASFPCFSPFLLLYEGFMSSILGAGAAHSWMCTGRKSACCGFLFSAGSYCLWQPPGRQKGGAGGAMDAGPVASSSCSQKYGLTHFCSQAFLVVCHSPPAVCALCRHHVRRVV